MNADLSNRLKEVLLEGHWIANTNFQEQLRNTTWQQAVARVEGLNTIAALTYHVHYYFSGLLDVFNGIDPRSGLIRSRICPYLCRPYWSRSIMDITWVSGTQDSRSIRDGITIFVL